MRSPLTLWLLLLAVVVAPVAAQEIYRVVDEEGNVTYTDQKPDDDTEPLDLPELNVMEEDEAIESAIDEDQSSKEESSLDFRIRSPEEGETVTAGQDGLEVSLHIGINIPEAATIVVYLNGQPQDPIRSLDMTVPGPIPEGMNQLRAELQTPEGRVLASTPMVNFTVASAGEDQTGQ